MEKITFVPDGGDAVDFYVLEQTVIGGVNYILVTDAGFHHRFICCHRS